MLPIIIKQKIENKFGRKVRYAKDCEALSYHINKLSEEKISPSTIMRLFGLKAGETKPRLHTLDLIAHYIGFESWGAVEDFLVYYEQNPKPIEDNLQDKGEMVKSDQVLMFITGVDYKFTWASKSFQEALKYSYSELLKLKIFDIMSNETRIGMDRRVNMLLNGVAIKNYAANYLDKDGNIIQVCGTITPVFKNGSYFGAQGKLRLANVGTPCKCEQIEQLSDSCIVVSKDLNILFTNLHPENPNLENSSSWVGKSILEAMPGVEQTRFFGMFTLCLEQGQTIQYTDKFEYNGLEKWYDINFHPFSNGIAVIYRDITNALEKV